MSFWKKLFGSSSSETAASRASSTPQPAAIPQATQSRPLTPPVDLKVGLKIVHKDGEWAIITGVSDRVKVDGWHSADGSKFEPYGGQGWPLSVAKHFVEVGEWTAVEAEHPTSASCPSTSPILVAMKSLLPFEPCQILYFGDAEQRDKAYQILMSQFASDFEHIERRSVSNRQVMYAHWIVVGDTRAYKLEMQETLKKAGCVDREEQYVDYRTVLADSDPAEAVSVKAL
jgi:hypothetical protein